MAETLEKVTLDLETEELRPVRDIAAAVMGAAPSKATIWRWYKRGNRGGKLEAVFIANKWRTTRAAFLRFLERQTAAQLAPREPIPVCDGDTSDEALAAAGLL